MKSAYYDEATRSIIDVLHPGELFPDWTISRVSVPPPHRGQGIARRLMGQVLADADAQGAHLHLEVAPARDYQGSLSFDQLYAWYTRCGFKPSPLGYPCMVRPPKLPEADNG